MIRASGEFEIAAIGDTDCVVAGFGAERAVGREDLAHFLGAFHVDLLRVLHPVLIVLEFAGRDTDQCVVCVVVLFLEEVRIVSGDEWEL